METLANDLEPIEAFGLYPTLAVVSAGVFALAQLARAVENYIRHLHKKPYLPPASPRFLISTAGYVLVADGFVIGGVFSHRLPLLVATLTISAGLLCLIASIVLSVVPYLRGREPRHGPKPAERDRHEE